MTIKVARMGRLPEHNPFAGTCSHCRTAIECVRADGDFQEGDFRDQHDHRHLNVRCPTCGGTIHAYSVKSE